MKLRRIYDHDERWALPDQWNEVMDTLEAEDEKKEERIAALEEWQGYARLQVDAIATRLDEYKDRLAALEEFKERTLLTYGTAANEKPTLDTLWKGKIETHVHQALEHIAALEKQAHEHRHHLTNRSSIDGQRVTDRAFMPEDAVGIPGCDYDPGNVIPEPPAPADDKSGPPRYKLMDDLDDAISAAVMKDIERWAKVAGEKLLDEAIKAANDKKSVPQVDYPPDAPHSSTTDIADMLKQSPSFVVQFTYIDAYGHLVWANAMNHCEYSRLKEIEVMAKERGIG